MEAKGRNLVDLYESPSGILGVEQDVSVTLAPDLPPVVGRIDLIRQGVLADIKTSATRGLADPTAVEAQLGLYRLAYPAERCEAIVLAKTKAPSITVIEVRPWSHARLEAHYREVYQAMQAGCRFAVHGWHCKTCPYRDRCHGSN